MAALIRRGQGKLGGRRPGRLTWSRQWTVGAFAFVSGSSAAVGFVWAIGWVMHNEHAELLGIPPSLLGRTQCFYDTVKLIPNSLICAVLGPSIGCVQRGEVPPLLFWVAVEVLLVAAAYCVLRRGLGRKVRLSTTFLNACATLCGIVFAALMGLLILRSAKPLLAVNDVLIVDPPLRKARFEDTIDTWGTSSAVTLASLTLGNIEDRTPLRTIILGSHVWAVIALLAWVCILCCRLTAWGAKPQLAKRVLAYALQVLIVLCAAYPVWFVVRLHGLFLERHCFPGVREASEGTWRRLAYLGVHGDLHYLYDCEAGTIEVRPNLAKTWQRAPAEDVLNVAYETACAASRSLLRDGSFEVGVSEGKLKAWKRFGRGAEWTVFIDDRGARSGRRCLYLRSDSERKTAAGIKQSVVCQPEAVYRLTVYVRAEGASSASAETQIRWKGAELGQPSSAVKGLRSDDLGETWQPVRLLARAPAKATTATIKLYVGAVEADEEVEMWFDDVLLEVLPAAVPALAGSHARGSKARTGISRTSQ